MTPITGRLFGGQGEERAEGDGGEEAVERVRQLRRGTEAAVASLPEEHRELGRTAAEAARRVEELVAGGTAGAKGAPAAARDLERLHFALVRLSIQEHGDEEAVAEAIRSLESGRADAAP
jgi:hypothetical protein